VSYRLLSDDPIYVRVEKFGFVISFDPSRVPGSTRIRDGGEPSSGSVSKTRFGHAELTNGIQPVTAPRGLPRLLRMASLGAACFAVSACAPFGLIRLPLAPRLGASLHPSGAPIARVDACSRELPTIDTIGHGTDRTFRDTEGRDAKKIAPEIQKALESRVRNNANRAALFSAALSDPLYYGVSPDSVGDDGAAVELKWNERALEQVGLTRRDRELLRKIRPNKLVRTLADYLPTDATEIRQLQSLQDPNTNRLLEDLKETNYPEFLLVYTLAVQGAGLRGSANEAGDCYTVAVNPSSLEGDGLTEKGIKLLQLLRPERTGVTPEQFEIFQLTEKNIEGFEARYPAFRNDKADLALRELLGKNFEQYVLIQREMNAKEEESAYVIAPSHEGSGVVSAHWEESALRARGLDDNSIALLKQLTPEVGKFVTDLPGLPAVFHRSAAYRVPSLKIEVPFLHLASVDPRRLDRIFGGRTSNKDEAEADAILSSQIAGFMETTAGHVHRADIQRRVIRQLNGEVLEQRFPWLDRSKTYLLASREGSEALRRGIQEAGTAKILPKEAIPDHVAAAAFDPRLGWRVFEASSFGGAALEGQLSQAMTAYTEPKMFQFAVAIEADFSLQGLREHVARSKYGDLDFVALALSNAGRISDKTARQFLREASPILGPRQKVVFATFLSARETPAVRFALNSVAKAVGAVAGVVDFPGETCSELLANASPQFSKAMNPHRTHPAELAEALLSAGGKGQVIRADERLSLPSKHFEPRLAVSIAPVPFGPPVPW
jgi:hypothetical protein